MTLTVHRLRKAAEMTPTPTPLTADARERLKALRDYALEHSTGCVSGSWASRRLGHVVDVLDALLASADMETPPSRETPRCATCRHDTYFADCKANWRRPIVGVKWKQNYGCNMHEPTDPEPGDGEKETR